MHVLFVSTFCYVCSVQTFFSRCGVAELPWGGSCRGEAWWGSLLRTWAILYFFRDSLSVCWYLFLVKLNVALLSLGMSQHTNCKLELLYDCHAVALKLFYHLTLLDVQCFLSACIEKISKTHADDLRRCFFMSILNMFESSMTTPLVSNIVFWICVYIFVNPYDDMPWIIHTCSGFTVTA